LVAALVVAVLAIGGGVAYLVLRPDKEASPAQTGAKQFAVNTEYLKDLPFDFAEPKVIKPTGSVELKFDKGINVRDWGTYTEYTENGPVQTEPPDEEKETALLNYYGVFEAYSDPALTSPMVARIGDGLFDKTTVVIEPRRYSIRSEAMTEAEENFMTTTWWQSDVFYVSQTRGSDGSELDRPLVTPVFVDWKDSQTLGQVGGVAFETAADGSLDLSWDPVDGATQYYVMLKRQKRYQVRDGALVEFSEADEGFGSVRFEALAQTTETTANSAQDATSDLGNADLDDYYGAGVSEQNLPFSVSPAAEDQIAMTRARLAENPAMDLTYSSTEDFDIAANDGLWMAVVGFNEDGSKATLPEWKDLRAELARLPSQVADQANGELRERCAQEADPVAWGQCQAWLPVIMADGHTAQAPAAFDFDTAEHHGEFLDINVSMAGQGLAGQRLFLDRVPDDWRAQLEAGMTHVATTGNASGLAGAFAYSANDWEEALKEFDGQTAADTLPDVPYPVNGSSDYVKFVAANLIAGNYYLDITAFADGRAGTPMFDDVVWEAVYQNPFILQHAPSAFQERRDDKIFAYVSFPDEPWDAATVTAMQEELAQAVERGVAESVTDGMSDRDKAWELDKWLASQAAYDYDALPAVKGLGFSSTVDQRKEVFAEFPYNQTAYGVMVYGKGVCASYAQAYKALLDAAGVEAVVVVGETLEVPGAHAWNKVKMDGNWLMVDPTWSDGPGDSGLDTDKYFGLTDKESKRVDSWEWMVDTYLKAYDSN
jgi:hypothetical protein